VDKNIVVCALARDCEQSLKKNIPKVEYLRSLFGLSSVIVVENDSVDGTKDILLEWKNTCEGVILLSEDYNTLTIPPRDVDNPFPGTSLHRIEKMSFYRNIYMDHLSKIPFDIDYVIMIDIDIIEFSPNAIYDAISNCPAKNWGALFANGYTDFKLLNLQLNKVYHDMYAYLAQWKPKFPQTTNREMFLEKKTLFERLNKTSYFSVTSAFGGIGIYRYDLIKKLRYRAVKNQDRYIEALCEHVLFNKSIQDQGYQNYIVGKLQVYYGSTPFLIFLRRILPLGMFKLLCLVFTFRKLKE